MLYKYHRIPLGSTYMDCVSFGRGSKPLVILPGLSVRGVKGAGFGLALMYRSFGRHFRVFVFDKPAQMPENCDIKYLAETTAAAMRALGIEKAALLGVSMGGMIALELAIGHPELVGKLIPALTAARPDPGMEKAVGTWLELTEKGDYAAFARDMFARMYSPGYLRRYGPFMPILCRLSKPQDVPRFRRLARACLTADSCGRLGEIDCPSLVIGAEEDRVVSPAAARELAEALGCPLRMYEGLGHAAYEEAADFNDSVLEFFLS